MIEPYFYTFQEFLAMGKHGVYVWSCWGITLFTITAFILYSRYQRRQLIKQLTLQQARRASKGSSSRR